MLGLSSPKRGDRPTRLRSYSSPRSTDSKQAADSEPEVEPPRTPRGLDSSEFRIQKPESRIADHEKRTAKQTRPPRFLILSAALWCVAVPGSGVKQVTALGPLLSRPPVRSSDVRSNERVLPFAVARRSLTARGSAV